MTTCKSHPRSRKPGMPVAPDGRLRKRGKWRPTPSDGAETAGRSSFGFPGYPMNQPSQHPLDALWQAQTLVWVVLAGECIALVLALAPGGDGNRWVYFGLRSEEGRLGKEWVRQGDARRASGADNKQ